MNPKQFLLNEKNFNQFKKKFGLELNNTNTITFTKNENKINVSANNSLIGEIIGNDCPLLNMIEKTTIFNKNNSYNTRSIHQMSKIIEHLSNINTIYFKDKNEISTELIYEGELKNGKADGVGKITTYKGDKIENIYIGEFKNGEPYGLGEFKFGDNNIYKGEFKSDYETCIGYMKSPNFEYYGEFKNLMFDGRGILKEENKELAGTFKEGTFLNFTNNNNNIIPLIKQILINVNRIVSSVN